MCQKVQFYTEFKIQKHHRPHAYQRPQMQRCQPVHYLLYCLRNKVEIPTENQLTYIHKCKY